MRTRSESGGPLGQSAGQEPTTLPDGGATGDGATGSVAGDSSVDVTGARGPGAGGRYLDLQAGEQVLAVLPSLTSVLSRVPEQAFENVLVVSVRHPRKVQAAVEDAGGDPRRVGVVPVSASPVDYDGPMWTAETVSPSDLTGISIRFARGMRHVKPGEGWVVIDGLGTLLMYTDDRSLYRLLAHIVGRSRDGRVRGVHGLAGEVVAETTLASLRDLYDRTVDVRS